MTPWDSWLIYSATAGSLLSLVAYLLVLRGHRSLLRWARFGFHLSASSLFLIAAVLMHLILTHRFDYQYVHSYSSTDLPLRYLFSSFWAGQEGTIVLWALYTCLMGLFVMSKARRYEVEVQVIINVILLYQMVLMLNLSPFARLDTSGMPAEMLTPAGWPREGNGLNPLLQNPWMVIHPPILFLGYASMVLPFAFAMAGLLRREYDEWVRIATPWVLLAWTSLGLGIFLGGYWAYETLGWGGYWAWDPVENASFMPWLMTGALLHGLLLQRARGGLRRANFWLATGTFTLVLYGSYLTRSGVLGDFSVHSFVELSAGFNRFLLGFVVLPVALAAVLFFARVKEIRSEPIYENPTTRSFGFFFAVILFLIAVTLVWLGTSAPVYTGVFGNPRGVQASLYNRLMTPFTVILLLAMAIAPLLGWRHTHGARLRRKIARPLLLALLATALTAGWVVFLHRSQFAGARAEETSPYAQGIWLALWILVVGAAYLAASTNGYYLYEILRHRPGRRRLQFASFLAHVGMALFLIGVVISSVYERKARVELPLEQPIQALGFRFTYRGLTDRPDARTEVNITVEDGRRVYQVAPLMYMAKQGLMKSPAIRNFPTFDLYIEPDGISASEQAGLVEMGRDEPVKVGNYTLAFKGFQMPQHTITAQDLSAGAVVEVQDRSGKKEKTTAWIRYLQGVPQFAPVKLFGGRLQATLTGINADRRTVSLQLQGEGIPKQGRPETAIVWLTRKPFINVVWAGWLVLVLGTLLSAVRRTLELRAVEQRAARLPTAAPRRPAPQPATLSS